VRTTRRLLFAKQLLTETALPITEVALAAGFGSLRRFNAVFRDAYRMAPRDLRKRTTVQADDTLSLRLSFRPPFNFEATLDFLRARALPGVEHVDANAYARVVAPSASDESPGWLRVARWPGERHALQLQVHGLPPSRLLDIVGRVRRMFDLDAEPRTIAAALSVDARLRPLVQHDPGLRLPGGWEGFEVAVRAILGQQVSMAAACTLAERMVRRFGQALPASPVQGLRQLFPTPEQLVDADLVAIGVSNARAHTVRTVARAVLYGDADFRADATLEEFVARWSALPGIAPWTAHYIAMRALGHPDAFPADDHALVAQAQAWRPWRAYAVIHLWRDATQARPLAQRAA
jgi:AraC family transcriptional regulator of adaptative response / DNA-3-methyladenine glycosylase II